MRRFPLKLFLALCIPAAVCAAEMSLRSFDPQSSFAFEVNGLPLMRYDALMGADLPNPKARVVHRTSEFEAEYVIDERGLREGVHAVSADESAVRVLVLGDSFAFGAGVRHEESWPSVLEQNLNGAGFKVKVINAGVMGFNTFKEARYLERIWETYKPRVVILGFMAHDVFENDLPHPEVLKHRTVRSEVPLVERFHTAAWLRRRLLSYDEIYCLAYRSTARGDYFLPSFTPVVREKIANTEQILNTIADRVSDGGGSLMVFSIPQQFQVITRARGWEQGGLNMGWMDDHFEPLMSRRSVPWIRALDGLSENYKLHRQDLYYRVDGHLNVQGHRVAASIISKALERIFMKSSTYVVQ